MLPGWSQNKSLQLNKKKPNFLSFSVIFLNTIRTCIFVMENNIKIVCRKVALFFVWKGGGQPYPKKSWKEIFFLHAPKTIGEQTPFFISKFKKTVCCEKLQGGGGYYIFYLVSDINVDIVYQSLHVQSIFNLENDTLTVSWTLDK